MSGRPDAAWVRLAPLALAAALLAGCASVVAPPPATPQDLPPPDAAPLPPKPPPPAPRVRPGPSALVLEQRWLTDWFRGTPVLVVQDDDGQLVVEVPRQFSFEPGRSELKPALAAVLDKVAEILRRRPGLQLSRLAAPDDVGGRSPLALLRALQVQRHLRLRGVAASQLGEPTSTTVALVKLRIGSAEH